MPWGFWSNAIASCPEVAYVLWGREMVSELRRRHGVEGATFKIEPTIKRGASREKKS
jgi:hypothetical protein